MRAPGDLVLDRPGIGARLTSESVLDLARCTHLFGPKFTRRLEAMVERETARFARTLEDRDGGT
jgi:hypothetical protein